MMKDGLYRVVTDRFVAGFVVEGGLITKCAPILRNKATLYYYRGQAKLVKNEGQGEGSEGNLSEALEAK